MEENIKKTEFNQSITDSIESYSSSIESDEAFFDLKEAIQHADSGRVFAYLQDHLKDGDLYTSTIQQVIEIPVETLQHGHLQIFKYACILHPHPDPALIETIEAHIVRLDEQIMMWDQRHDCASILQHFIEKKGWLAKRKTNDLIDRLEHSDKYIKNVLGPDLYMNITLGHIRPVSHTLQAILPESLLLIHENAIKLAVNHKQLVILQLLIHERLPSNSQLNSVVAFCFDVLLSPTLGGELKKHVAQRKVLAESILIYLHHRGVLTVDRRVRWFWPYCYLNVALEANRDNMLSCCSQEDARTAHSKRFAIYRKPALQVAVEQGNFRSIKVLIERGFNPNQSLVDSPIENKPILYFLLHSQDLRDSSKYRFIEYLIDQEKLNEKSCRQYLFKYLLEHDLDKLLEKYLAYGANPNVLFSCSELDPQEGGGYSYVTPLMYAAIQGREAIVSLLLAYGASINMESNSQFSTLSSQTGKYPVVRNLCATAAYYAAQFNNKGVLQLLLDYSYAEGISLSITYHDNPNPLIHAYRYKHLDIFRILLQTGQWYKDVLIFDIMRPACRENTQMARSFLRVIAEECKNLVDIHCYKIAIKKKQSLDLVQAITGGKRIPGTVLAIANEIFWNQENEIIGFVSERVNFDSVDFDQNNILMYAIKRKAFDLYEKQVHRLCVLFNKKPQAVENIINQRNKYGETVLMLISQHGTYEQFSLLIKLGAQLNAKIDLMFAKVKDIPGCIRDNEDPDAREKMLELYLNRLPVEQPELHSAGNIQRY